MKKIIALVAFTLLCSLSAYSQNGSGFNYGLRAGVNIADFTSSTGSARTGFVGGAFVDYSFSRLGVELGVNYNQIGANSIVEQGVIGNRVDRNLDYVDAMLTAKYQFFHGFRVFVGPQCGYLVSAEEIVDGENFDISDITNSWQLSIVGGVGYTFKMGLDLSASYSHGVTPLFNTEAKHYNSTFNVSIGWRF